MPFSHFIDFGGAKLRSAKNRSAKIFGFNSCKEPTRTEYIIPYSYNSRRNWILKWQKFKVISGNNFILKPTGIVFMHLKLTIQVYTFTYLDIHYHNLKVIIDI